MKKLIAPFFVALLVSFTSCDKIEELLDITFDTELESPSMTIAPPMMKNSMEGISFDINSSIDISDDSDIAKYLDKIKNWDINKLQIQIISVSLDNTEFVAGTELNISNSSKNATYAFAEATPIDDGDVIDIPSSFYSSVEDILDDKEKINLNFVGGLNNDATVIFKVIIDVKITANPL